MKRSLSPALAFALVALAGCSAGPHPFIAGKQLKIEVSGTPAKTFTASYHFAGMKGSVATAASPEPKPVLEGTVAGDGMVEVKKEDPLQLLTLDIYEGKAHPVHLVVPSGRRSARAIRNGPGWHIETE
jgi:hypothetical protein